MIGARIKRYNLIKTFKKTGCLILGHDYNWSEYDERIEKEQHHAAGWLVFCNRCKEYKCNVT